MYRSAGWSEVTKQWHSAQSDLFWSPSNAEAEFLINFHLEAVFLKLQLSVIEIADKRPKHTEKAKFTKLPVYM